MNKAKTTLLASLQHAGTILRSALTKQKVVEKKSELSLVTETDRAAEKAIIEMIHREYPEDAILAEESPPQGSSHKRWIIDPLDGTTNFTHSYPVACVSIGYEEEGQMQLGGVYDPFRDELFFAERGKGAVMNGRPIQVSANETLADSILATGFPYDRREDPDLYLNLLRAFMMKIQGIRRSGSAALDLCYVACGRFDGFWEFKLQAWDKAAGSLIIEEAGGKLSDYSGNPLTMTSIQNVASNRLLHAEMLEVLRPFQQACL